MFVESVVLGEEHCNEHEVKERGNERELFPVQVKSGVLRSEHQKMALRTIKETMETELHKRNKERDKDRQERLQTQQLSAVPSEPLLEGDSVTATSSVSPPHPPPLLPFSIANNKGALRSKIQTSSV